MNDKVNGSKVVRLPPSDHWRPDQAIAAAAKIDFSQVLIVGFNAEGELVIRSSNMTRAEALWLLEKARDSAKCS